MLAREGSGRKLFYISVERGREERARTRLDDACLTPEWQKRKRFSY